jgi:hypothetical protein
MVQQISSLWFIVNLFEGVEHINDPCLDIDHNKQPMLVQMVQRDENFLLAAQTYLEIKVRKIPF